MNKKIKKIIPLILITSLLLGLFSITASAISESCLENHFQALVDKKEHRVPPNVDGSCGYVAMSSLLAFYDSYWHEDFVPDKLEWVHGEYNSANDSLNKTFSAQEEYDDLESWEGTDGEFFDQYRNDHLQPYLVKLGEYVGCFTLPGSPYGLFDFDVEDILKTYLYTTCGFTEDQVTVHKSGRFTSTEDLKETIKQQIVQGYPVLYFAADILPESGAKSTISDTIEKIASGHIMVAYDVADNNGVEDIKLLTGWNMSEVEERYQWLSETPFNTFHSIIWLEINEENLPHECSYNYVDSITKEPLCACQIYSTHPGHSTHIYRNKRDNEKHWKECVCGDIIDLDYHNLICRYMNSHQHYINCDSCAFSYHEDHIYEYEFLSSTEHKKICYCGEASIRTEEHYDHSYSSKNNFKHDVYCACGHYMGTETHTMVTTGRYANCTLCGVKVDTFSDITIKGFEDDESCGQIE